jgi:hypothetical protein
VELQVHQLVTAAQDQLVLLRAHLQHMLAVAVAVRLTRLVVQAVLVAVVMLATQQVQTLQQVAPAAQILVVAVAVDRLAALHLSE